MNPPDDPPPSLPLPQPQPLSPAPPEPVALVPVIPEVTPSPVPYGPGEATFSPLRTDPPPRIFATWWVRYLLVVAQLVGIAVVLMVEYAGATTPADSAEVQVVYALAATMLVVWSALAMTDAGRLVPATQYRRRSSGAVAAVLWLVAFAAPVAGWAVLDWASDRFADDPDDLATVAVSVVAVLVCFVAIWAPFHYHTQQAHRIGAPGRVVAAWFWVPLLALVGSLLIDSLGLADTLADGGVTALERTVRVGVVFGLPALVFALTTWRATTVFDEVIDLRWQRWRTEWEQTIVAMIAQPAPLPEAP